MMQELPSQTGTFTLGIYDETGTAISGIIRTDQKWSVSLSWSVPSNWVGGLNGEWNLKGHLEGLSGNQEALIFDVKIPADPGKSVYNEIVKVSPGVASMGAYSLIVLLTYTQNGFPSNIAGVTDELVIQFYDPEIKIPQIKPAAPESRSH